MALRAHSPWLHYKLLQRDADLEENPPSTDGILPHSNEGHPCCVCGWVGGTKWWQAWNQRSFLCIRWWLCEVRWSLPADETSRPKSEVIMLNSSHVCDHCTNAYCDVTLTCCDYLSWPLIAQSATIHWDWVCTLHTSVETLKCSHNSLFHRSIESCYQEARRQMKKIIFSLSSTDSKCSARVYVCIPLDNACKLQHTIYN